MLHRYARLLGTLMALVLVAIVLLLAIWLNA